MNKKEFETWILEISLHVNVTSYMILQLLNSLSEEKKDDLAAAIKRDLPNHVEIAKSMNWPKSVQLDYIKRFTDYCALLQFKP